MMRALSAVSSERGLDPAGFGVFAFGGNGGVHVCGLAESLGITRVVVPPAAGLFSALGLIFADVEHQSIRAYYQPIDSLDMEDLNQTFGALRDEAAGPADLGRLPARPAGADLYGRRQICRPEHRPPHPGLRPADHPRRSGGDFGTLFRRAPACLRLPLRRGAPAARDAEGGRPRRPGRAPPAGRDQARRRLQGRSRLPQRLFRRGARLAGDAGHEAAPPSGRRPSRAR